MHAVPQARDPTLWGIGALGMRNLGWGAIVGALATPQSLEGGKNFLLTLHRAAPRFTPKQALPQEPMKSSVSILKWRLAVLGLRCDALPAPADWRKLDNLPGPALEICRFFYKTFVACCGQHPQDSRAMNAIDPAGNRRHDAELHFFARRSAQGLQVGALPALNITTFPAL